MGDIQNYNMEHVDTLAPDTIKESVMCRHSQLSLLLADIQGRISNAPEGSLRTARKAHGCQYYHKVEVNDTKGTYIKKHNYNFAIELAQKDYDLRIEQCLLKELNFLKSYLRNIIHQKSSIFMIHLTASAKKWLLQFLYPMKILLQTGKPQNIHL